MSLTLTRETVTSTSLDNQHAWVLKITAVSTTAGLPSEIFVFQAASNDDPYNGDSFQCVASVSQIEELTLTPVTAGDNQIPFYRSATVELIFRHPTEVTYYWEEIQKDAKELFLNFNAMLELDSSEAVTFDT